MSSYIYLYRILVLLKYFNNFLFEIEILIHLSYE